MADDERTADRVEFLTEDGFGEPPDSLEGYSVSFTAGEEPDVDLEWADVDLGRPAHEAMGQAWSDGLALGRIALGSRPNEYTFGRFSPMSGHPANAGCVAHAAFSASGNTVGSGREEVTAVVERFDRFCRAMLGTDDRVGTVEPDEARVAWLAALDACETPAETSFAARVAGERGWLEVDHSFDRWRTNSLTETPAEALARWAEDAGKWERCLYLLDRIEEGTKTHHDRDPPECEAAAPDTEVLAEDLVDELVGAPEP